MAEPAETEREAALRQIRAFLRRRFQDQLAAAGIDSGLVAELGGPKSSFSDQMPGFDFEFLSLFGLEDDPRVRVADITHCPQIESERYDAVLSANVFEHVRQPWLAAREIQRILRPGGLTVHLAPFSYFYHKAPEDYWRFTPTGLSVLFEGLEVVHGEFYGADRRRDNRGGPANPVDRDGGPQFGLDDLGGWRENWHALFVGRKPTDGGVALLERRRDQQLVDLVKAQVETGVDLDDAVDLVRRVVNDQTGFQSLPALTALEVAERWTRRPGGVRVSGHRFSLAARMLGRG